VFRIKVEVRGREHLKNKNVSVVVCNHQSVIDIYCGFVFWADMGACACVMKREMLYVPVLGVQAKLAGSIFVDRTNTEQGKKVLKEGCSKYLATNKAKVFMFPEGTRNANNEILPFKKGAFHVAIDSQVPIVPVVISSYSSFYNPKQNMFNPGKVIVTVLPPVETKSFTANDVDSLIEKVRNPMVKVYKEISEELKKTEHSK